MDYKPSIWKRETNSDKYLKSYHEVDNFFEELYQAKDRDGEGVLRYREEQHSYALDIMEAIRQRQILLIQAGVGIGKSYGYLLPIFYTHQNVPGFDKIVISTSSIALQKQLLRDIDRISEMIGIPLKARIAKGIHNYACMRKIESWVRSERTPIEKKKILKNLLLKMEDISSSDREDLKEISHVVWDEVRLQSRGYCSNCSYVKRCPFYREQLEIQTSNIIITNHANLVRNALENGYLVNGVDMFVMDEAHQLENSMHSVRENFLSLKNIIYCIDQLYDLVHLDFCDGEINNLEENFVLESDMQILKQNIHQLFSSIRRSSSGHFYCNTKNEESIVDCGRLSFRLSYTALSLLENIIQSFEQLFSDGYQYELRTGSVIATREFQELKKVYSVFSDMRLGNNSKNIYWANFYEKNLIHLCYLPKSNLDIANMIFKKEVPIVCTSGTMLDNRDSYRYFMDSISLDGVKGHSVVWGENYLSPYPYDENVLFYHNPKMLLPSKENYHEYIVALSLEIEQLIRVTNGKALILFTSKKCMRDVYEVLNREEFPFSLLLHTDMNTNEIKERFANDMNSCLLATGAFFEGVDIKGISLSHLIITHLPFDVVDAVSQYKASRYQLKSDQFHEVYVPSMLIKFSQAVGRLIRSDTDKGIVSCLDARFEKYQELIANKTQITNYTTDMQVVRNFSDLYILPSEEKGYTKILK